MLDNVILACILGILVILGITLISLLFQSVARALGVPVVNPPRREEEQVERFPQYKESVFERSRREREEQNRNVLLYQAYYGTQRTKQIARKALGLEE